MLGKQTDEIILTWETVHRKIPLSVFAKLRRSYTMNKIIQLEDSLLVYYFVTSNTIGYVIVVNAKKKLLINLTRMCGNW